MRSICENKATTECLSDMASSSWFGETESQKTKCLIVKVEQFVLSIVTLSEFGISRFERQACLMCNPLKYYQGLV